MVLDYLKVLIWPATVLAIVYGFRGQFRNLILRLRLLSGGGIDAEFSEQVIEASEEAEAAVLSHPPGDGGEPQPERPHEGETSEPAAEHEAGDSEPARGRGYYRHGHYVRGNPEDDALIVLAETYPEAAVVASFVGVEAELRRLEDRNLPRAVLRSPVRRLAEALALPNDIRAAIIEMSELRNRAAHGEKNVVSSRAARAYVRSCRELIDWLKSFGDQPRLF
ncbi:hypothetical protein AB0A66_05270 [Streptomyces longwoodensis]|uniref:hypothetical protein n=1 Tax=Streptomyces longwoodensis TaxID=68231 RepID=UPI0033EF6294